ncbi:hypothetical protein D3C84_991340 [compost metagenome]
MAALSASKLVWLAMDWITWVTRWISSLRWLSRSISSRLTLARWLNWRMQAIAWRRPRRPASLFCRTVLAASRPCWLSSAVARSVTIICSALLTMRAAASSIDSSFCARRCTA